MSDDLGNLGPGDVRGAPPDPSLVLPEIAGFDRAVFLDSAQATFLAVKQAIMARDLTPVAARLGAGVAATLQGQVDQLAAQNAFHRFDGLALFGTAIAAAEHGKEWDSIAVRFDAKAADYAVDQRGNFVFGSQDIEPFT